MAAPRPRSTKFHPAFVVPRYGAEVVGGAEDLARRTAEELASRGFRVSALSTRALDHHTWRDHYPAGSTVLNGVEVTRFDARTNITDPEVGRIGQAIVRGDAIPEEDQRAWLSGVISSDGLLEHIRRSGDEYSHLIFLPYLFGTTYLGSSIRPEISYIVPCLHDEPYAHMPLIKGMLQGVRGLMFNSEGERRLAARLLESADPGPVVGMGFRAQVGDPAAFRDRTPVRGDFILYAGRREEGKNTPLLIEYFRRFARERPGLASLVLMGAGDVTVPADSSHLVYDAGRVTERQKWDGYSAATVFCQPSVNESLSIVLLESWLAGRPALVHRGCDVTREHVAASGGGLAFGDYPEFAEALGMVLEDESLARAMGAAGRAYVEREYNWDSVIRRLFDALGVRNP
ncbi:MAG: glycosyltransferase family 4 protein [Candidatus Geothermincolia bacterium]